MKCQAAPETDPLATAIFIISTFATPEAALKPLDCPTIFGPITSLGFAA